MIWDESDIVYTLWGYRPLTTPATKWIRISNGNWRATDRGPVEDIYEADIVFRGPESEMVTLAEVLDAKRTVFNVQCGKGEEIFGADIDYSDLIVVTVVRYGQMKRAGKAFWSIPLKLRLRGPEFIGSASMDNLRLASFNYTADSNYDMTKLFTYEGRANYLRSWVDTGIFSATFKQTFEEMKAIRRYLLTTGRTDAVPFPASIGVDKPFGERMGTGPFNCRIIDWKDSGRPALDECNISIKFAREFE